MKLFLSAYNVKGRTKPINNAGTNKLVTIFINYWEYGRFSFLILYPRQLGYSTFAPANAKLPTQTCIFNHYNLVFLPYKSEALTNIFVMNVIELEGFFPFYSFIYLVPYCKLLKRQVFLMT